MVSFTVALTFLIVKGHKTLPETTVRLTLTVTYKFEEGDETPDPQTCKDQLDNLVKTATNRGLLSGDHEFVVDRHSHGIEVL
jgi:hypothetical protein